MPYLGNDLQVAQPSYRNIDDISGSFNSSTTSFPLLVSGAAPVPFPINSNQCLISVAGVVQRPDDSGTEGFRISGGNIIFSSAPSTGADFFGVILAGADYVNVGANFPSGSAAVPSITFDSDLDTGIYNSAANQVSITTAGTERLRIDSAGQIEAVSLGTAAAPSFSFTTDPNTGIYSPGADQVAISTNGTGRLFINSSGNVGLGTSSPGAKLQVSQNTDAGTAISVVSASASTGLTTDYATLFLQNTNTTNNNYNAIGFVNDQGGYSSAIYGIYTSHTSGSQSGALAFSTRNAGTFDERMRITAAGNVGIGITSPNYRLHVVNTSAGAIATQLFLQNSSQNNGTGARIDFSAFDDGTTATGSIENVRESAGLYSLRFKTFQTSSNLEAMRIDGSGRLLVGTSSSASDSLLQIQGVAGSSTGQGAISLRRGYTPISDLGTGSTIGKIDFEVSNGGVGARIAAEGDAAMNTNDYPSRLVFSTTADGASSPTERMRISNNGHVLIGATSDNYAASGIGLRPNEYSYFTTAGSYSLLVNRLTDDGDLIYFYRGAGSVGSISVSGSTVSYNQFLGSHWSAFTDWSRPEIKVGTILESINELTDWKYAVIEIEGEQKKICYNGTAEPGNTVTVEYEGEEYQGIVELETDPEFNKAVKVKVNDTAASKAVYGVFVGWNNDSSGDGGTWNDMYVGAVGNYVIRMAEGQEPEIGDLVEADGTGCAVVQDDDIIRTKTVAKITSTIPQVTYDDGSFLVTCVLYCG